MPYRTLVLFVVAMVLAVRPASAKRYTVEDLTIVARVQSDGSMQVREVITYDLR